MSEHIPVVGISCGDLNGIGIEVIIKTLSDKRLLQFCTPVIFASNKTINFYRKTVGDAGFQFQPIREFGRLNPNTVYIYNCWDEEVNITPGILNEIGGDYAKKSLIAATEALQQGHIEALITAPIHKSNVHAADFPFSGHTPFLRSSFEAEDVLMFMVSPNMRVGLVTEHVPVGEVPKHLSKDSILSKLRIMAGSLRRDFGVDKPKIAVLGLNPHSGDDGLIGSEEKEIIKPAIQDAKQNGMLVFGPYAADAFFARHQYQHFDGVLAMYHDQGLIPFKSLSIGEGVNFTAGLKIVRTSPDHGTAFDIAGKNEADHSSFMASLFEAVDIIHQRKAYDENHANPIRKMSEAILRKGEDLPIDEDS